jgi:hypothetical protein
MTDLGVVVASAFVLVACGAREGRRCEPPSAPACLGAGASTTRWIGWRPRVPLATTTPSRIEAAGQSCCAPWASVGGRWRAVDGWGQVLGTVQVASHERYDATQCLELAVAPAALGETAVLLVGEDDPWTPTRSLRWSPEPADEAVFAKLVESARALYGREPSAASAASPTFYFERIAGEAAERYGAVGGPLLVVAQRDADGAWRLAWIDSSTTNEVAPDAAYRVLAVLDMDRDGGPEIVYQRNDGTGWIDVVVTAESDAPAAWHVAAEGVGGGSI